jgi:indolepyruvate ferredoxin oxidoreductase alpha subunit
MVPGNAYRRHIALEQRLVQLADYAGRSPLNNMELNDPKIGIIAGSVAYLYAKEMYPGASFLKLGMSYPFPDSQIREFASKVKELVVIEELEPFLEEHIRMLGIPLRAKHPSFRVGELRPELIPAVVKGEEKKEEPAATRKPVLCPGCQHRPVFWTLKKLKLTVAGDIGCYTLGALPPLSALHSCLCMGAGVTFFEGMGRVLGKNVVGVIGDSTFVHSGITGLINAAYNGAKGLLIILDNSTTAMTGSQPNPATGVTIKGTKTKRLSIEEICRAAGADAVDVVDPYNVKELETLIAKRAQADALSVIITRFPCQIVERRKSEPPHFEKEKCKKCYLCLNVDCPALTKTEDGLVAINPLYCTGCNVCVAACACGALQCKKKK